MFLFYLCATRKIKNIIIKVSSLTIWPSSADYRTNLKQTAMAHRKGYLHTAQVINGIYAQRQNAAD